jgi:hypothetical protein
MRLAFNSENVFLLLSLFCDIEKLQIFSILHVLFVDKNVNNQNCNQIYLFHFNITTKDNL